jgi:hypothetical protein
MMLINLLVLIIVVGVLLWAVNRFIPMASVIKSLLNLVVLVVLVIYILEFFGIIRMILPIPMILN